MAEKKEEKEGKGFGSWTEEGVQRVMKQYNLPRWAAERHLSHWN